MAVVGLTGLVLTVADLPLVMAQWPDATHRPAPRPPDQSNAERIYFTATDARGQVISYGGMMMRMTCAQRHGADGHAQRTMKFVSPNITYENLTDPRRLRETDGSEDGVYIDTTIKRAITEGLDAEG